MIVYEVRKGKSGNCYVAWSVMICSLGMLALTSFLGRVELNTENVLKESLDCSRKNFDALKCCVCVANFTADTTMSNKCKFSSKGLNKRTFEDSGDGP